MRHLPEPSPASPDLRSPTRFLLRAGRLQWPTLAVAIAYGVTWMVAQAVLPFVVGRAIDQGVVGGDTAALWHWVLIFLGLGVVQAVAGIMRHRFAVTNWLRAMYFVTQLVTRKAALDGRAVRARLTTGEVTALVNSDAARIGGLYDVSARFVGAVVAYVVVAFILLSTSVLLGVIVLVGVPVLLFSLTPVLRPLQARQAEQRHQVGELTALGADTVAGLRVLRGIGGEDTFLKRYVRRSSQVRDTGVRVAGMQAALDAAQVLLPGIFIVIVTWVGARLAMQGRISPGDLVAFYGYATFLVNPLRTATEMIDRSTRAYVGAGRVITMLSIPPLSHEAAQPAPEPGPGAVLVDGRSGLRVEPGVLLAVVSADPDESGRIADRLGRFADDDAVTFGGVRLLDLPLGSVRRRILVSEADPQLFSGPLGQALDPSGQAGAERVGAAIAAASAHDVMELLDDGFDTVLEERGRSLSGGQRQRLVLARALLTEAEILVLVEPTSAVDAHTEARIAQRLARARGGLTTVVVTASPLLLDRVDEVAYVVDGVVVDRGPHRDLMAGNPAYRATVTREEVAV